MILSRADCNKITNALRGFKRREQMNKQIYIPEADVGLVLEALERHGKQEKSGKIGVGSLLVKLIKAEEKRK